MLRSVHRWLVTDILGQPIGPVLKVKQSKKHESETDTADQLITTKEIFLAPTPLNYKPD
jgi:hypothetical protein